MGAIAFISSQAHYLWWWFSTINFLRNDWNLLKTYLDYNMIVQSANKKFNAYSKMAMKDR